jgi:hypothetical protein
MDKGTDPEQDSSKSEKDYISLSEMILAEVKEETIKSQLLQNKFIQKHCRYHDGYVYQPVFSC